MFGSNIQSSWANPQQNQQQQQPSAFGQPAFGATGFGSTGGAFGQNTQQQPAANPMFGNLGAGTSTSTGNTGFGTFGSNANQSTPAFGAFGAPKPATGFGAFGGGGGTFGGGGFAQPSTSQTGTTGTSIFGQPSTAPSAFASGGGGLFGSKPASTFGSTTTANTQATPPVVTTGTSNPPFQPHADKDATSSVTLQYQAITCMPAYSGYSFEELRLQDYAQGRKTASTFGQSTFGATQPTGAFGTQTAQPSAFGSTGTAPSTGFGAFGQNTGTATTGGGLFGGFGSQQQQQQTQPTQAGFGAFGSQTQPQQQTTSAYGGGAGTGGAGAFGATANKPAFGTFGSGGGFGAFGQQNQQQQQQQQSNQPSSIFGSTQPSTGFGAFGSNANKPSIFGNTQTTQPSGFGAFGAQQQQQQQQPQGQQSSTFGSGSLFGGGQQQPQQGTQQTGSIFGSGTTQPAGTGVFGGSLFGGQQQQQQQPPQQTGQTGGFGGLFGNKPATTTQSGGGLFGAFGQQGTSGNTTQPGLFGSTLGQTSNQSTLGGGLFGAKPAAPTLGTTPSSGQTSNLFGSLNPQPNGFNANISAPGTQATLTASISQPIVSSDLPLSSLLPSGPRLINLDQAQPKKKAGFFVDVPTRSPVPRVQLGYTPASSKLRGFTTPTLSSTANSNPFTASMSLTSGKPGALTISKAADNKSTMAGDPFIRSSSPSLGSGTRQSVKKVVLDKKIDPAQIFAKSGSPGLLKGGKVTFSPALSVAVREKDAAAAALPLSQKTTPTLTPPRAQRTPNKFTAKTSKDGSQADGDMDALEEGDYYVKPPLATLKKLGHEELSSFTRLVVGRIGYGEIEFLEPVDLTGLPKLSTLLGDVIRFEDKECSVYPDSEEVDKPPPGSGLNVKARIALVRCWAVDKATREPIKDASHPVAAKHLKRLQHMKDTHFESFDIEEGKWTFVVDHF